MFKFGASDGKKSAGLEDCTRWRGGFYRVPLSRDGIAAAWRQGPAGHAGLGNCGIAG